MIKKLCTLKYLFYKLKERKGRERKYHIKEAFFVGGMYNFESI